MTNLTDTKQAILLLMEYAVNDEDITAARELVERHQNDRISLNVFHEFYSFLPEAKNDAIKFLKLLTDKEGGFLLAAGTTNNIFCYFATTEGAEFLGPLNEGIWDKDVLDFFSLSHEESIEKFKNLKELPFYIPAHMDLKRCPICSTNHGELHRLGCPVEICPWCGGQLTKCHCRFQETDRDQLTNEAHLRLFKEKLNDKGRLPFNATEQSLTLG